MTTVLLASPRGDKKVARYSIESIFCIGCVSGIQAVVGEIEGVESVAVDVENHQLTVVFDSEEHDAEWLRMKITEETTFKLKMINVNEAGDDGDS